MKELTSSPTQVFDEGAREVSGLAVETYEDDQSCCSITRTLQELRSISAGTGAFFLISVDPLLSVGANDVRRK